MGEKACYATAHWLRFEAITTPDQLELSGQPQGALSWKIGPSGPVGPDGYRLPANIWCAVGLFREDAAAHTALDSMETFMPFVACTVESWHQLLLPVRHHGECNHLERDCPGAMFEIPPHDPGGLSFVLTTAGFRRGPDLKVERLIDFRRNVDVVNDWIGQSEGCLASRPFTPHTLGDDGYTMSVWRDDAAMLAASYRAGTHRTHVDLHKQNAAFDRSSFTRLRILRAVGQWNGRDPLQA
jgi:hypothetical protein